MPTRKPFIGDMTNRSNNKCSICSGHRAGPLSVATINEKAQKL